jgi:hypothetical protein
MQVTNLFHLLLLLLVVVHSGHPQRIGVKYDVVRDPEGFLEEVTTLLTLMQEGEPDIVINAQDDPRLGWTQKVTKILGEGVAEREDLLRRYGDLVEHALELVRAGKTNAGEEILELKPAMDQLRREVKTMRIVMQAYRINKRDEL